MSSGEREKSRCSGIFLPDQNNPYSIVVRDADGHPVYTETSPYVITNESMELRGKAYEKFWQTYPAMVTLPEQLPLELRSSLKQGEDSKGGYFLHYGFLTRPEQLQDCVSKLKLDCTGRGPSAALSAIAKEIARRSEGTLEPWLQLCDRLPVPDRDERLGPDRVIALYSNGNIGIGSNGMPYTPKEKADYIQLLGDILSPFTGQKEPMWYWDHSHAPNFSTLKNKEAWDVADVVILEDDED